MPAILRLLACLLVSFACSLTALAGPGAAADATRFFRAVQMDDASTVSKLMAGAFDPNQLNPLGGEPALVLALREGSMRVFQALLANPATRIETAAVNGNTALMMAAFKKNRPAVEALLARGAIVTKPGWTALHYAAAAGDDAITALLLEHNAYIDAESPAGTGKFTPLMMAAREGHASTVQLLLDAGADAALVNTEKLTAAQIADKADKTSIGAAIRAHLGARGIASPPSR